MLHSSRLRYQIPQPLHKAPLIYLLTTAGAAALPSGRAARHAAAEQLPRQEPEAGEHGRGAAGSGRA